MQPGYGCSLLQADYTNDNAMIKNVAVQLAIMNLASACGHAGIIAAHALLAHHTAVLATCQLAWYLTLLPYH